MEDRFSNLKIYPVHHLAFQNLQSGVLILDEDTRIVDLNPAAERILQRRHNELVGRPLAVALPEQAALLWHLQTAQEVQTEIELGAEGHIYALQITSLTNQCSKSLGRVLLLQDITQFKQSEAALRQYAQELEAQNRELDAFAHTVAHGLKNPLAALNLNPIMMQQATQWSPEKIQINAQRIAQIGNEMARIIDALLLLASVRQQSSVASRPLDMSAIVAEVLARLQGPIRAVDAQVTLVAQPWATAVGYAPWVAEVWLNYLDNALKYSGVPPRIILGATPHEQTGQIRFWVQDSGAGLTTLQQAQVFDPFIRFQTNLAGHGLGLSIVKRIVERLGGVVGVESAVGHGSIFYFTLPVA